MAEGDNVITLPKFPRHPLDGCVSFRSSVYFEAYIASGVAYVDLGNGVDLPPLDECAKLNWHPFNYFRSHGGFDAEATCSVVLGHCCDASDVALAASYCTYSIFMRSFQEVVRHVFKRMEALHQNTRTPPSILLPAGGIPYYVPNNLPAVVYDVDTSLASYAASFPKCKFVLGKEKGDVFAAEGAYDTICCVGFIFYLPKDDVARFLAKMHSLLRPGGRMLLNFISSPDSDGESGAMATARYTEAVAWNVSLLRALNPNPQFTTSLLSRSELTDLCKGLFIVKDVFSSTFGLHELAELEAI